MGGCIWELAYWFCRSPHLGSGVQANLLEERDPGVLLAIVTLLLGIVSRSYEGAPSHEKFFHYSSARSAST